MSEKFLASIAKSKLLARKAARSVQISELARAVKNLQESLELIQKEEAIKASKKRRADLSKIKRMMSDLNISPQDLMATANQKNKPRVPRKEDTEIAIKAKRGPKKGLKVAPRYKLRVGGKIHKWSGRGRMPLVFKEHIESGGTLEACLIK